MYNRNMKAMQQYQDGNLRKKGREGNLAGAERGLQFHHFSISFLKKKNSETNMATFNTD